MENTDVHAECTQIMVIMPAAASAMSKHAYLAKLAAKRNISPAQIGY